MSKADKDAYDAAASWLHSPNEKDPPQPGRKAGEYAHEDGMASPEEDFANNVEEMVVDEPRLKKISPGVYHWFQMYFGDSLKKGGPCESKPRATH
jgi:hypothetical protein